MILYQHAKNQAISSFCSRDIVHLNILQSNWLRAFWPISQEPDFPQITDLFRNTANNISQNKIKDQIFKVFNFWSFLGQFWGIILSSQKIWFCHARLHKGF